MVLTTSEYKIIEARRDRVWEAWTTPEQIRVWNNCVEVRVPELVGGALYWRFDIPGTFEHNVLARLRAVVPGYSCEYEWYGETGDAPTYVRVSLADIEGGRTELFVEHSGFEESTLARLEFDDYDHRWEHLAERLAAYVEHRPSRLRRRVVTGLVPFGGVPEVGMVIKDVAAGSSAREAGIEAGDVVRSIDGIRMTCFQDFHVWLDQATPGKSALFELQDRTIKVVPRAAAR
jgi:uncharacterized protein YndB with AHSA1/START domain